jgi:hypothetical protein
VYQILRRSIGHGRYIGMYYTIKEEDIKVEEEEFMEVREVIRYFVHYS